jgi:serine/threonine protein kinase
MILANKYEIIKKISEGSFGSVYKAKNIRTGELVAIKIERKNDNNINTIKSEAKIYQYLSKQHGFPQLKWYGTTDQFNYLVINLLVCSLTKLTKIQGSLSLKTILLIGIQLIQRIETLHSKYLLHRDIKPDNFLLGSNNVLYLIDFGFCKRYEYDGEHIEEQQQDINISTKTIIGTANFVSLNVHNGIEPSRRDDLESCIYILFYIFLSTNTNTNSNSNLNWFNIKDLKLIVNLKQQLTNTMDPLVPTFIRDLLKNVRALSFKEKPNYGCLINILEKVFKEMGIVNDGNYDWN